MPRAFTEQEKQYIRRKLLDAGLELFGSRSIRKVSVDELANKANISKGSFYSFFSSKEELYFSLLDEAQRKFKADILTAASKPFDNNAARLKHIFRQSVQSWLDNPLSEKLGSDDLEYVLRNMPPGVIEKHMSDDADFSSQIIELCRQTGIDVGDEPDLVSGLLRSVFLVSLHEKSFSKEIHLKVIYTLFDLIAEYITKS